MLEQYSYIKSLHVIFVITWFSGLFYIPRLYVYFIEAQLKSDIERQILSKQFLLMIRRLWNIITWPSAILSIVFGVWILFLRPSWIEYHWMHLKLLFITLLIMYHIKSYMMYKEFREGKIRYSSNYIRVWNEGATILLFAIVFLVVLKNSISWIFGLLGLLGLSTLLIIGIKLYKKVREKTEKSD